MRYTLVSADDLRAAIERTGYYPGLVTDAVWSALGPEPVQAYVVQHDAIFDPGMEVRRHITVLALTPTRLIYSHTDEHPAEEPDTRAQAETSTTESPIRTTTDPPACFAILPVSSVSFLPSRSTSNVCTFIDSLPGYSGLPCLPRHRTGDVTGQKFRGE